MSTLLRPESPIILLVGREELRYLAAKTFLVPWLKLRNISYLQYYKTTVRNSNLKILNFFSTVVFTEVKQCISKCSKFSILNIFEKVFGVWKILCLIEIFEILT